MLPIILIVVGVISLIGLIVGLFKGYTKLSCWGGVVVGTLFFSRLVRRWVPTDGEYYGLTMLLVTLGIVILLTVLFWLVRRFIKKQTGMSEQLSFYRTYDERQANKDMALEAVDRGNKRAFRKYANREPSCSRGPWGVVDRIFGGITLALNCATAIALIGCFVMLVVDLSQIRAVTDVFADVFESPLWTGLGVKCAFDALVIALMCMSIRLGYKWGICSALGAIIVLGLLVASGYIAYHLAFNVDAFVSLSQSLADGGLKPLIDQMAGVLETMEIEGVVIAQCAVTAGLFLVFLILVIIIGIFIPHLINKIMVFKTVRAVDGTIGAVVFTAILFGILLFLGSFVYQIGDLEAFAPFNSYMNSACVSNCLYAYNPLNKLEFMVNLPLREWFNLEGTRA